MKNIILLVVAIASLAGCAQHPESVTPTYTGYMVNPGGTIYPGTPEWVFYLSAASDRLYFMTKEDRPHISLPEKLKTLGMLTNGNYTHILAEEYGGIIADSYEYEFMLDVYGVTRNIQTEGI